VVIEEAWGDNYQVVREALQEVAREQVMERLWERDYRLWKDDPREITNRLGWLAAPDWTLAHLPLIQSFVEEVRRESYRRVLLLGMGGSSLAPKVLARYFGTKPGYLTLQVLDTTDPAMILQARAALDEERTLIVVSSKSGTTVETDSLMKYLFRELVKRDGLAGAARHMVAITDPGSKLAQTAETYGFRRHFLNAPDIGGRYSALSYVGIVPATLGGLDCRTFLERASQWVAAERSRGNTAYGARLGVGMGEGARKGRDKLVFLLSPRLTILGEWLEQLIAESTGKEGKGILPVVMERSSLPSQMRDDHLLVSLRQRGEAKPSGLRSPLIDVEWEEPMELGPLFFLWELATAVAAQRLRVNPFDQPDVERAKEAAREILVHMKEGVEPSAEEVETIIDEVAIAGANGAAKITALFDKLFTAAFPSYVSIQAYITPDEETLSALQVFRLALMERYGCWVTVGFGPQYLHSTGQLHKGDGGRGLFLQWTEPDRVDVLIPEGMDRDDATVTFGMLRAAQARGDRMALRAAGRRVVHFHFPTLKQHILRCWAEQLRVE